MARVKKPKGWKPGKTPKFKKHPSVVRYRDPEVRSVIGIGYLDGATHVQFVCNPDCCDYCHQLDGTIVRTTTALNWVYTLPHPNCKCAWIPGYKTKHGWQEHKYSRKSLEMDLEKSNKAGMVKKKVAITRDGKTFYQERWVRQEEVIESKPKEAKKEPEKKETKSIYSGEQLKRLQTISSDVSKMKEGESKKFGKVKVKSLAKGFFSLSLGGSNVLVKGVKPVAIIVDHSSQVASTSGALLTGDLQGKGIQNQGKVGAEKVQEKTKEKIEAAKDKLKDKPKK